MPRIRTIKPEFFDDEDLAALPIAYRLGFIGLWCQADKAGRLEDRPVRLKARIFPFDDVDVDAMLTVLAAKRFIVRYELDSHRYIAVRSWGKHQRPRNDEEESKLPAQPSDSDDLVTPQSLGKEGNGKEKGKGMEGSAESLTRSTPDVPVLLTYPTIGSDGTTWRLRKVQVDEWQGAYPNLDVMAECRRALSWVIANPGRRKTVRGMPKFLNAWLSRAVDSGRGLQRMVVEDGASEPVVDWFAECQQVHGGRCGGSMRHRTQMILDAHKGKVAAS